jgi:hypothetical protein
MLVAALTSAVLAACGGGSGGPTPGAGAPPPADAPPPGPSTPPGQPPLPPDPDPGAPPAPGGVPTTPLSVPAEPPVPPPAPLPPVATPQITPLGTPRILVSHAPTLERLRQLLAADAPSARRFKASVDAQVANGGPNLPAWQVALMGQVTNDVRYCNYAVAKTDEFVASEEARIADIIAAPGPPAPPPGGGAPVPPLPVAGTNSYLYVGELIGGMATVYDWCRAQTTADQRQRWRDYGNQAVWNVWNHTQARWGNKTIPWSGWSHDNPANNYYYAFLEATMLLGLATQGENPMAADWIEQFRQHKLESEAFPAFTRDHAGGGSLEGTGYGTAMKNLWRIYDWWEKSTGERIAGRSWHTLESLPWMMHAIVPTLSRLAATGDHSRDETAMLFDYHRDYLQVLIHLYPDEPLSGVARTLLENSSVPAMTSQFMRYSDFLYDPAVVAGEPLASMTPAYFGSGTGMLAVRSGWDKQAAYANLLCGPLVESHAHRDNSSFTLFKNVWSVYEANIDGHSGIEQDEEYHNLVRYTLAGGNAVTQRGATRCNMQALAHTPQWTYALADTTPMYGSAVTKSEREFVFIPPAAYVVYDRAQTAAASTKRTWTMNFPKPPTLTETTMSLDLGSGNSVAIKRLLPQAPVVSTVSWAAVNPANYAGKTATRIDVTDTAPGNSSEFLHVIGLNGSVTASFRDDADGQTGVTFTLADGRTVTTRFNKATRGGTLEIRRDAQLELSGTLPTHVHRIPLFPN